MASNQKMEENRPPFKFDFTYWVFSPVYNVYTPLYTMYTMLVSGIISSTSLATVQNQILNMSIIPFYNLQTDLETPPSR